MIVIVLLFVFAAALQGASGNTAEAVEITNGTSPNYVLQHGTGVICNCVDDVCSCCGLFNIPLIKLKQEGCMIMKYIGKTTSLDIVLELNEMVLVNKTVSANDAPHFCFSIPEIELVASMCMDFYNIEVMEVKTQICLKMVPKLIFREFTKYAIDFGCFTMYCKKDLQEFEKAIEKATLKSESSTLE